MNIEDTITNPLMGRKPAPLLDVSSGPAGVVEEVVVVVVVVVVDVVEELEELDDELDVLFVGAALTVIARLYVAVLKNISENCATIVCIPTVNEVTL